MSVIAPISISPPDVFLGGECGATTWRQDIVIPILLEAGITFYNPQVPVGQWSNGMIEIEAVAKDLAKQILIVIGPTTRGTTSIMEAVEYVCYGTFVHLVVDDVPDGAAIGGEAVTGGALRDANRPRAYLRSLVKRRRPHLPIHATIGDAVSAIIGIADAYRLRDSV